METTNNKNIPSFQSSLHPYGAARGAFTTRPLQRPSKYIIKFLALISSIFLVSCATSGVSPTCSAEEPLPIKNIDRLELSNYWKPAKKRERIHFKQSIERDITNGVLYGFVVVEQTINASGEVVERELQGYFPDERVRDVYLKYARTFKYISQTCPIQPVRYRAPHTYSNGNKVSKQLIQIYEEYEKNL